MKKIFKENYKVGAIILFIIAILAFPTTSNASLQSRPNATSLINKSADEFFLLCRQMETSSGPLGLNATIEVQDDKVVETSNSNGIDVHMIKNTEYGTAAMLAASAYGNCPQGFSGNINDSTTQNESGIMQMAVGKYEYVAGIYNEYESETKYIHYADARYKNVYDSKVAADAYIPGDATYETSGWRVAGWGGFVNSNSNIFYRSRVGVFYFHAYNRW